MPPSGSCSSGDWHIYSLLEDPSDKRFDFRLYSSLKIKTTRRLESFVAKTCQKFCSQAPTGRSSTTLGIFVTGVEEGGRSVKEASFTSFIWISLYGTIL